MKKLTSAILIPSMVIGLFPAITLAQKQGTDARDNKNYDQIKDTNSIYPRLKLNSKKDRILILAPHCDDELLTCGGIIQEALNNDVEVHVIFLTNGDGFRWAAMRNFRRLFISAKKFIKFGRLRQQEAIEALKTLGLPTENMHFLGYPDRGLKYLWGDYWHNENIYSSRYTGVINSPYSLSYKPNRPYTGKNLLEDLTELLAKYKPTKVFVSSPFDEHSDHWATYNFLHYTLAEMELNNRLKDNPEIYQYLTHRGQWPTPEGENITPPRALADNIDNWTSFLLTQEQIKTKAEALKKYKSQLKVTKRYLFSFIKNNEIFIKDNREQLDNPKIKRDSARLPSQNPSSYQYREPIGETRNKRRFPGGDIKEGKITLNQNKLSLTMTMNEKFSYKYKFKVNLYLLANEEEKNKRFTLNFNILPARGDDGVSINVLPFQSNRLSFDKIELQRKDNIIEVTMALPKLLDTNYIFFNAESYYKSRLIDRTAWKVIAIN